MLEDGRKFYSKEVASNVPYFFVAMALSWFVLALIALVFVRKNPNLKETIIADDFDSMLTFR